MISSQFFTTVNIKAFFDTLKILFQPHKWQYGLYPDILKEEIKNYLNAKDSQVYLFYNWRSALYHWLKALKKIYPKKNEVIVAGYTCVSVVNAIKQAGLKPIYTDIDETLNITLESIKKNFSNSTLAIIVQHTFWNPAKIDEITNWAKSNNVFVIEDCAHSLWATVWEKKVWTFWHMAIFSTWRDKVISSVTWWVLLINDKNIKINPHLVMPSKKLIFQNLFYNIVGYIAWKTYDIKIWKFLMYLAWKFKLIPKILTKKEKSCNFSVFYFDFPNALAYLAVKQLKILDKILEHRKKLANLYFKELNWLKNIEFIKLQPFYENIFFWFPVLIKDKKLWNKLVKNWQKKWIYFWVYWSGTNIVPPGTNLESCDYKIWQCPNAEKLSKQVLILPNHYQVSQNDVKKVVEFIKSNLGK